MPGRLRPGLGAVPAGRVALPVDPDRVARRPVRRLLEIALDRAAGEPEPLADRRRGLVAVCYGFRRGLVPPAQVPCPASPGDPWLWGF